MDDWGADTVISEVAERRLVAFETDHQSHRYNWLYMTDHSSGFGRAVLRALNLLAAGDVQAAAALVRAEAAGCMAIPAHAYSAALVLEAAGDHAGAEPFVDRALSADTGDTGAMALAARLRLATGRPAEASRLLARAVEAAPWNGALRELHVYSLIQDGQPLAASVAAEAALSRIRDHANLWYWAAVLREALSHVPQALDAVSHGLALDPENPAYLELSSRLTASL